MDIDQIPWATHTRACIDGDWLVVLDLRRDRYWALLRPNSLDSVTPVLSAKGLLQLPAAERRQGSSPLMWPEWLAILDAALWARSVVNSGRLDRAFAWIGRHNHSAHATEIADVTAFLDRFERMRIWIPRPYVCLFNSLCLIRFMLRRGYRGQLVFGVRARPFAAHCWVELAGSVLDDGGEDCGSFTEIARV